MIDLHPETIISNIEDKRRTRRTKEELGIILLACQKILSEEEGQISIRHLYYRLFTLGLIENSKESYSNLCHLLDKWRKEGKISYESFSDITRRKIGIPTFDDVDEALNTLLEQYRLDKWERQPDYLEIWCEKNTIANTISKVAKEYGVNTLICGGNSSKTSLYEASQVFKQKQKDGKKTYIYYFGDYDGFGLNMDRIIQDDLKNRFDCEDIHFTRLAIREEQIETLGLELQENKKKIIRGWNGGVCELDALSNETIQELTRSAIKRHIVELDWRVDTELEKDNIAELQKIIDDNYKKTYGDISRN